MAKVVTDDMIIRDILSVDAGIAEILMNNGMHCVYCPSASGESLKQACFVHGIDSEKMLADINAYLADKN